MQDFENEVLIYNCEEMVSDEVQGYLVETMYSDKDLAGNGASSLEKEKEK